MRSTAFCRRYYKCEPAQLPRPKKFPFAYLLNQVYAFTAKEVAAFFGCTPNYAYKLIRDAVFLHNHSSPQRDEEKRIANYILYNAQWRDGISV